MIYFGKNRVDQMWFEFYRGLILLPVCFLMDSLDSPLNLAHQQGRKADYLLQSKKYEEAIACHRRAAEYLLQALQLSPSQYAQESIHLQHKFHLNQQEAIQVKIEKLEKLNNKLANKGPELRNQSTQTEAKLLFSSNHFVNDSLSQESNVRVMQALAGTDSLVGHLLLKNKHSNDQDVEKENNVGYNAFQENVTLPGTEKDYEFVINQLMQENFELKKEISQLHKDLDNSKKDNRYLTDKVFRSERTKRHSYPDEEHGGLAVPDMELPPLEMPQFDFDSLQVSTSDNDRGESIFSTQFK